MYKRIVQPSNELAHDPVASISPYVENTDPMLYQRMNDYIAEMTAALGTNDLASEAGNHFPNRLCLERETKST